MKIYLLDRTDDLHYKWDIFDGFVIAADSEEEAIEISIKSRLDYKRIYNC